MSRQAISQDMVLLGAFFGNKGLERLAKKKTISLGARPNEIEQQISACHLRYLLRMGVDRCGWNQSSSRSVIDQTELSERLQDAVLQLSPIERVLCRRCGADGDLAREIREIGEGIPGVEQRVPVGRE